MTTGGSLQTLVQFLGGLSPEMRLFDMGRRITEISSEDFLLIENGVTPYPLPLQRHIWLALLFPQADSQRETSAWFLKLPLDEQAKLNQFARDDLMQRLLERMGENAASKIVPDPVATALQDNPYSFKPRDELLAVFHAKVSRLLETPVSKHHDHALAYFRGELGWDQWSFLGYQGIADIAARIDEDDTTALLKAAIPELPARPLEALCQCLEHARPSVGLASALAATATAQLESGQPETVIIAAAIRGVSNCQSAAVRDRLLTTVLSHPVSRKGAILTAVSGRAWEALKTRELASAFLTQLAENSEGQSLFNQCLSDLLYIPGMREPLLHALRAPERPPTLSEAVGNFFQQIRG